MVPIIIGIRDRIVSVSITKEIGCQICHKGTHFQLVKSKKRFTIFFCPIFPYGTRYQSVCNICGTKVELSKDHFYYFYNNYLEQFLKSDKDNSYKDWLGIIIILVLIIMSAISSVISYNNNPYNSNRYQQTYRK